MSEHFFPATPEAGPRHFASDCLPRLALEPTMDGAGLFDGAWWPRSYDLPAELPDLITALTAHLGQIRRIALDTASWANVPPSITVNGEAVRIGWLTTSAETISLRLGILDQRVLLVVPPETAGDTAAAAMASAAMTGNSTPAGELLSPDGAAFAG